jgi:hypothetical protein
MSYTSDDGEKTDKEAIPSITIHVPSVNTPSTNKPSVVNNPFANPPPTNPTSTNVPNSFINPFASASSSATPFASASGTNGFHHTNKIIPRSNTNPFSFKPAQQSNPISFSQCPMVRIVCSCKRKHTILAENKELTTMVMCPCGVHLDIVFPSLSGGKVNLNTSRIISSR